MNARSVLYDHEIVQQFIMHEKVDLGVVAGVRKKDSQDMT